MSDNGNEQTPVVGGKPFVNLEWDEEGQKVLVTSNAKNFEFMIALINLGKDVLETKRNEARILESMKGIQRAPSAVDILGSLRMPQRRM